MIMRFLTVIKYFVIMFKKKNRTKFEKAIK